MKLHLSFKVHIVVLNIVVKDLRSRCIMRFNILLCFQLEMVERDYIKEKKSAVKDFEVCIYRENYF